MLTCLIVCLSQGPLVSVCVCVPAALRRTRATTYTHTYMHSYKIHTMGKSIKTWTKPHSVSVRYCRAHVVSVCPIKTCSYQGGSLKSSCCFVCAETSAHIPPMDLETVASHQQLQKQLREERLHNPLNMLVYWLVLFWEH